MFLDEEEQNILPLSGYPIIKTLMCNENGKLIKYFSDRYGFNNNDKIYDNNNFDILMIGDSIHKGYALKINLICKTFFQITK